LRDQPHDHAIDRQGGEQGSPEYQIESNTYMRDGNRQKGICYLIENLELNRSFF
jgi:hypothetical protein